MTLIKIQAHSKNGYNLKLFFDDLGLKNFWSKVEGESLELAVVPADEEDFVLKVVSYYKDTGNIPYHYCSLCKGGTPILGEKFSFDSMEVAQESTFRTTAGKFRLILFKGENEILWKTYSTKELPLDKFGLSGKIVTQMKTYDGNMTNLAAMCRTRKI